MRALITCCTALTGWLLKSNESQKIRSSQRFIYHFLLCCVKIHTCCRQRQCTYTACFQSHSHGHLLSLIADAHAPQWLKKKIHGILCHTVILFHLFFLNYLLFFFFFKKLCKQKKKNTMKRNASKKQENGKKNASKRYDHHGQ